MGLFFKILRLKSCTSTNTLMGQWLREGKAQAGTVILADEQTAGRGRFDRIWHTAPGNIALSAALPLSQNNPGVYQINTIGALALIKTIQNFYGLPTLFKWPNDVLIRDLKTSGLLSETVPEKNMVIFGLGVNLNSLPEQFPDNIKQTLTTIRHETNTVTNTNVFLRQFLHIFAQELCAYYENRFAQTLSRVSPLLAWQNTTIFVREPDKKIYAARILGLNSEGFLHVVTASGAIQTLTAADILSVHSKS